MSRAGTFTTVKQALEIRGAHVERVLEIDLTDPGLVTPDAGWYTRNKTLYLTDSKDLVRSKDGTNDAKYAACVLSWGDSYEEGDVGLGLNTTSDTTYTLANHKIAPQLRRGDIAGFVALSPEPDGMHLRLSDLCALYQWTGAVVRELLMIYEGPTTDQNSAAAPYQDYTVFTGRIANVRVNRETIVLDVIADDQVEKTKLPEREITVSPIPNDNGKRVPIALGAFGTPGVNPSFTAAENGRLGVHHELTPILCTQVDATDPSDYRYAWHDAAGANWTSQTPWGTTSGAPDDSDVAVLYHEDIDAISEIRFGTGEGLSTWIDGTTNALMEIVSDQYITARCWIRCDHVASGIGHTDRALMVDSNPNTYGTLDLDSIGNYVELRLPQVSTPPGFVLVEDNSLLAWVAIEGLAQAGLTKLKFGLWRTAGTPAWVGSSERELSDTNLESGGIFDQVAMPIAAFTDRSVGAEPPLSWQWLYSDGGTHTSVMRVRIQCSAANAGDKVRIIAAGIVANMYVPKSYPFGMFTSLIQNAGFYITRGDISKSRDLKPDTPLFVRPSKTALDDASGTITGTPNANLTSPAHQAAYLILARGSGASASDLILNASTFGSFRDAATDLDKYLDDVTGGSALSWKTRGTIEGVSKLSDSVTALCENSPMMVRHSVSGQFYASVFPKVGSISGPLKYKNNAGAVVYFHPNYAHPSSTQYGEPYGLTEIWSEGRDLSTIANRFRVRYRRFRPTKVYERSIYVDADSYSIWSETAGAFVTEADSDTLGNTLMGLCASSATAYQRTDEMIVELDFIGDDATATAALSSIVRRNYWGSMILHCTAFLEALDLMPGHVVLMSNDLNNVFTKPQYQSADWSSSGSFFVRSVTRPASQAGVMVAFVGEEIVS